MMSVKRPIHSIAATAHFETFGKYCGLGTVFYGRRLEQAVWHNFLWLFVARLRLFDFIKFETRVSPLYHLVNKLDDC